MQFRLLAYRRAHPHSVARERGEDVNFRPEARKLHGAGPNVGMSGARLGSSVKLRLRSSRSERQNHRVSARAFARMEIRIPR